MSYSNVKQFQELENVSNIYRLHITFNGLLQLFTKFNLYQSILFYTISTTIDNFNFIVFFVNYFWALV